jgi:ribosomal protein L34E
MKPSERFTKKTWRKPPKKDVKGHKMPNKTGMGKCAICKQQITSRKIKLSKNSFKAPKSTSKSNKPYGGYICNKCLRLQAIQETRKLEQA